MSLNIRILCLVIAGLVSLFTISAIAQSVDKTKPLATLPIQQRNLVILQYHHVSTDMPKSTSVTPEVFAEHMALLAANYNVVSLDDALIKIKNNQALPDKAVAITFDDGYSNILENAHPILIKHNFPYTIFINPALIGESRSQLTWSEVKSMQPLAIFANHTLDHAHLLEKYGNENQAQWLARVMRDVKQAESIIEENVGYSKKWLAYPYGEYNLTLKKALLDDGYIGFGQHSGPISAFSDFGALPRFPAAGIYAKISSLTVKLDSLAMPIDNIEPARVAYVADDKVKELHLLISDKDVRLTQFACYFRGDKQKFLGDGSSIKVKLDLTLSAGRSRVNCTAPSKSLNNRFYWFSHPMFTATHEGQFLD